MRFIQDNVFNAYDFTERWQVRRTPTHSELSLIHVYQKNHSSALEKDIHQSPNLHVIQFLLGFHQQHMSSCAVLVMRMRSMAC